MKIYAFEYNYCSFESSFETVSLHFKKVDAYKSMRKKKLLDYQEWLEMLAVCGKRRGEKIPEWKLYKIVQRTIR